MTLHRKTGKIEHNGIKIEFIGQIELYYDRGNHHEFLSLVILWSLSQDDFCYDSNHWRWRNWPGQGSWHKTRVLTLSLIKLTNHMKLTQEQMSGWGMNTANNLSWIQLLKLFRYFLRVTIVRRLTDMTKELDLAVHTLATYPEMNNPIKMEVIIFYISKEDSKVS